MAKQVKATFGPLTVTAANMTACKDAALASMGKALDTLADYRPNVLLFADYIVIVYPCMDSDGTILFMYTNPRTAEELSDGPDRMNRIGSGGMYRNATEATSAATVHIMTCFMPRIPANTPDWITPDDRVKLDDLRRYALPLAV